MPTAQDIREEQVRMVRLRVLADLTAYRLRHARLSRDEVETVIGHTRELVLEMFPDKGEVFDLVLRPRFMRIMNERALAEWGLGDAVN
jgi:hypothetical protein